MLLPPDPFPGPDALRAETHRPLSVVPHPTDEAIDRAACWASRLIWAAIVAAGLVVGASAALIVRRMLDA